jgi:microsomal prostaglandin-E synthase 2
MLSRLISTRVVQRARSYVPATTVSAKVIRAVGIGSVLAVTQGAKAFCSNNSQDANKSSPLPKVYQYHICPFCHRAKSYLDYLKIDYETVEVNPLTKSEISFSADHKKVPIAILDGQTIKDSGDIVRYISANYLTAEQKKVVGENFIPADFEQWMEWSEKRLAVMLYPNITRSFEESWECFAYSDNVPTWNAFERLAVRGAGSAAMFFANGKIKKKYGIVDERQALKDVLVEWTTALGEKKFLHGESITLPDLMVYGVLRSIRSTKTFREIMEGNNMLKRWFDDVDSATVSHEVCAVNK